MYLAFFGLAEKPFAITPDPRYLYLSARHADALAHLVYGINDAGGFVQLTGEVGTGKTTTIRSLLARAPKNAEIALVLNPRMSPTEFLRTLCEELGLGAPDTTDDNTKDLIDPLNRYLLRAHADGRRVVLIVDEAQNLSVDMLEQVRLLTNLETETQKLLQIILIGQPELRDMLARPELRQLAQRVTARYHLAPLAPAETGAYVRHRLRVAGATADIFTHAALREVHRISGGVPRLINILCDRALLGAYTQERHQVNAPLVRRAGEEIFGHAIAPSWLTPLVAGLALLVLGTSAVALWHYAPQLRRLATPAHHPIATAPAAAGTTTTAGTAAVGTPPVGTKVAGSTPVSAAVPLADLLQRARASTDTDSAFAQLFALWKAQYAKDGTDACSQAKAQGLLCMSQRGSLAQLRELNRPAILMLNDGAGGDYQVVLTALSDDSAHIRIGAQNAWVHIADLTQDWLGDFVLLWRPGTKTVQDLTVGMRGAPVLRLRHNLEHWLGQPDSTAGNEQYDDELMQRVEQFQRAHRLPVDGVAGVETQVALDAAVATDDSPLLISRDSRS